MKRPKITKKGSVLIVALLFAIIISVGLTSYVQMSTNSMLMSQRTFINASALNYVEYGIEEAMASYNLLDDYGESTAWSGWTSAGGSVVRRTFSNIPLSDGSTATVRVWVENKNPQNSGNPRVVAKATITPPSGPGFVRMTEIRIRRRGIFAVGMVARGSVTLNNNTTFDSWNSDPDNDPATPGVPYSPSVRRANAFVGVYAANDGALNQAGSDVYGRLGTGGGTVSYNSGAILTSSITGTGWNSSLLTKNFTGDPLVPTAPNPGTYATINAPINANVTFPRVGDPQAADGKYYYVMTAAGSIAMGGNHAMVISPNAKVVFIANTHYGATSFATGSTASITVSAGATMSVYTNGNVNVGGTGVVNLNTSPSNCLFYGTNTSAGAQTISISGTGDFSAAIYAPNANVTVSGNGNMYGSIVGNTISSTGNASFHYDEALANFAISTPAGNPFGIVLWRELTTATERAAYTSTFEF